jgi:hypothetical protein
MQAEAWWPEKLYLADEKLYLADEKTKQEDIGAAGDSH